MQRQTSTHQSQICAVANHPALAARLALVAALPLTACFNHGMPLDSTVEVTPGTAMVDAVPAPTLLVTTYNVHRIASEDLLQAFLDTPQLQNADIVLLQEVYKSDECSPACYVANALGRHALYAPGHGVDDGEHSDGVAIISKQPLAHAEVIELPDNHVVVNGGRRIALYAQAQWGARAVHVYAVHLENRINSSARRAQLLPVLQHARALVDRENAAAAQAARAQPLVNRWGVRPPNPRAAQRSTVVIAGDMNTSPFSWGLHLLPWPKSQTTALETLVREYGFDTPVVGSGSTHQHLNMRLDAMYTSGADVRDFGVDRSNGASDHYPLWARLYHPASLQPPAPTQSNQ